jgi:hypothetical protein
MGIVAPPGTEFTQPRRARGLLAQRAFNYRIDKDTIHDLKPCRESQQLGMLR